MNEEELIPYVIFGCSLLIALAWTLIYLNERKKSGGKST